MLWSKKLTGASLQPQFLVMLHSQDSEGYWQHMQSQTLRSVKERGALLGRTHAFTTAHSLQREGRAWPDTAAGVAVKLQAKAELVQGKGTNLDCVPNRDSCNAWVH